MGLRTRRRWLTATLAALLTGCGGGAGTPPASTVAAGPTTVAPPPTTVATTTTVAPAPAVTLLPLGDGKRSAAPEAGSLFACQTTFGPAGGAFRDGPWILGDGRWDPSAKLHVQGSVAWPQGEYDARIQGATRVITTNGVPAQATTGVFPVAADDPAYQYDRNPNTIRPRATTLTVPTRPAMAGAPTCVNMGPSAS